jgi:hypothetical protein
LKFKYIVAIVVCLLLFPFLFYSLTIGGENEFNEFYVGVDVAYADLDKIESLVDHVANYTNFFVIGSTGVTYNQNALNKTIKHLTSQGLSYSVFAARADRLFSINKSVSVSGDSFIGVYYDDEVGGHQLDRTSHQIFHSADNYSDAATQYINYVSNRLNGRFYLNSSVSYVVPSTFKCFTSEYALYWFDFKAGYDVVLAQLGWNYSRQLNVALCRGAATIHDRDWGVIVAWTYTEPPYLGSGDDLFDDMVLAYENGAKYILVFDSDEDYTQTTLKQEHLDAMERFWQYKIDNPRPSNLLDGRVAFVLPEGYGYGFRGPYDKIWGLWESDEFSRQLSVDLGFYLREYGSKLDVVYDDGLGLDGTYKEYFFWNGTTIAP